MTMYRNNETVGTGTSVVIIAADKFLRMFHLQNEGSEIVYVKFGSAASSGDYDYKLEANSWFELKKEDVADGTTTDGLALSVNIIAAASTSRVNAISF